MPYLLSNVIKYVLHHLYEYLGLHCSVWSTERSTDSILRMQLLKAGKIQFVIDKKNGIESSTEKAELVFTDFY